MYVVCKVEIASYCPTYNDADLSFGKPINMDMIEGKDYVRSYQNFDMGPDESEI